MIVGGSFIGTNIGTTSTAILSALGATSNARRVAATHVLFNLVTGAVAILLLPLLIGLLGLLREWFEQPATPAVMIAMFHTAFNVLGVLLMVPLARPLLRYLAAHFRSREEEIARPRHLDAPSLAVPDLALRALRLELGRTQSFAVTALTAATRVPPDEPWIERQATTLDALAPAKRRPQWPAGYVGCFSCLSPRFVSGCGPRDVRRATRDRLASVPLVPHQKSLKSVSRSGGIVRSELI